MDNPFLVRTTSASQCFQSESFLDTAGIRNYFTKARKDEDSTDRKYENLDKLLDFFSEITDRANWAGSADIVKDEKGEVPVSLDKIYDYCIKRDDKQPPLKIIVKIAAEDFDSLLLILDNPRKILRRDRQLVELSRIQQLDNFCIRWYARQPGYTAEQKAGERQKLMGVVRYESVNTLENRVLKQYLKYCSAEGHRYIRNYRYKYKGTDRILLVQRFIALVDKGLGMPEMAEISDLHGVPGPNYTLQNNVLYRKIWHSFMLLANHISLLELLWKNRHKLFHETARIIIFSVVDHYQKTRSSICHDIWIKQRPDSAGSFTHIDDLYIDYTDEDRTSLMISDENGEIRIRKARIINGIACSLLDLAVQTYFIPQGQQAPLDFSDGVISLVYSENDNQMNSDDDPENNVIKSIFLPVDNRIRRAFL